MAKIVTISGYKSYELGIFKKDHASVVYIKAAIRKEITSMIDDGLEWVMISGQLGVELWAAEVIFELRDDYPQLQLAVLTPFLDQESKWSETNKEWYESVMMEADFVDAISKKPYEKPWQLRLKNQYMIEKSDELLLVYDTEKDGSPKFLYEMAKDYQQKQDYPIRLITFHDIQSIVEEEQYKSYEW